jgi:hypothetical protein
VQVIGETPLLRPEESSSSTVIDRSLIEDLPLNGRKYTNFDGAHPEHQLRRRHRPGQHCRTTGWRGFGIRKRKWFDLLQRRWLQCTNNYFADIVGRNRIPYLFGEDSIQEFQVTVSPYTAIYGGGAGFVTAVTRSGGNAFHGGAFYYNRNSAFEANDALDKAAGNPRPDDDLQQFGAAVGGPIVRNRLWFFADYEQQLHNNPIAVINPDLATNSSNLGAFVLANFFPASRNNGPSAASTQRTVAGAEHSTPPQIRPYYPVYLQQMANAINALNSNLGLKARTGNDWVLTPRLDYQATNRDGLFLSLNANRFNSPGGVILDPTVGNYGTQTLANAEVRTFQATVGWTHTFSPNLLNEFHAGTSQDSETATPTGLAGNTPTVVLDSPSAFILGNAPFSIGGVFERQYSLSDRVDWVLGKHTLQFGFDFNRTWDADTNDGGADPNEAIDFGSPLGLYEFANLEAFALGEYINFNQAVGNPSFSFAVPYYGFYAQDTFRALPKLTLEMGLREDFQVYPQPAENPLFPLTGQYPNQFKRVAPRFGFAWQPESKTVVRGGFGQFYTNMNGLNYRNAVISNGLASQQVEANSSYTSGAPNNPSSTYPVFPTVLQPNDPLFAASPDISLVSPQFRAPYINQASLQIEREIFENTTLTLGTMWNHGVHIISGTAYDANLKPLQGTTNYIFPSGRTVVLPNMDSGLLTDGLISSNFGQIQELISPAQNHYNSLFVQVQHRLSQGFSLQFGYTYAKSIMLDGMDFNNQFDFSNTHAPSLLDQRHRLTFAAVYRPRLDQLTMSDTGRKFLSGWTLSSVMEFSSGRPYAGLLGTASGGDNLNDTAFNQDTAATAGGINGAGPTPGIGINSFYGPWLERIDVGLARSFAIREGKQLQFQAQAFNLFNHANYYVQNGDGINQIQYNPIGTNCGDGMTPNQTCYLVPNSGPGNFGSLPGN